jgi:hypothetical protein
MTENEKSVKSAIFKTQMSSVKQVANLVAAYRRLNSDYPNTEPLADGECMSVGVELPVFAQLAQFDKLLATMK